MENRLREIVKDVRDRTGYKQVDLARALGFSPKHISQMLVGHAQLSVDRASQMLAAMGYELELNARPRPEPESTI